MANYVVDYKTNFSGGEHDAINVDSIKDSELVTLINLDPDNAGGLLQREGTVDFRTTITDKRKDRIMEFQYLSGSTVITKRLELIDGKIIDPDTPDAGKTYKVLHTTSNLTNSIDYEVFSNKLYILTGNDYLVYDGTTITQVSNTEPTSMLADVKKCRYLIKKGDRMIFSGHSEYPNYVLYSERLRPDFVKNSSANDTINPIAALSDDGDVVSGLEIFKDSIVIFKRKSIFTITGVDPMTQWVLKRLDTHTGAVSHRTIDKVADSLIFLGYDKRVYRLSTTDSGDVAVACISTNKKFSITLPNEAHLMTAHSVYYKGKYILSVATGADYRQNDLCYVLNVDNVINNAGNECWYRYAGLKISDMLISYEGVLYMATVIGGKTLYSSPDAITDSGTHIKCVLEPHSFNGVMYGEDKENALRIKKYKTGHILFRQFIEESTNILVYRNVDGRDNYNELIPLTADTTLVWEEGSWDNTHYDFKDVVPKKFNINKRGLKCAVRIETDPSKGACKLSIYGVGVQYKLKKIRG